MSSNPNDRLISAIGMMDASTSAGDGEGVNAYRQATRLIKAQGLTWRDVAQRAFGPTAGWSRPSPAPSPAPTPAPTPQPAPAARTEPERRSGRDIPVTITGTIRALDSEGHARKSQMLVLEVETDDVIYGPLVAYAGTLMDNILKARGRRAMLRIRPARDGRQTPQVVGCSPM